MDKIDYLEKELSRLLGWIQAADTRITLVLPLTTAMLGVLAVLAPKIGNWTIVSALATFFSAFFLVLSIICLAFASFPRTNGPKGSMIFFSGINSQDINQFKESVSALNENYYIADLVNQCHINAKIAGVKFTWVKRSLINLFVSSLPWFLSVHLLYGVR